MDNVNSVKFDRSMYHISALCLNMSENKRTKTEHYSFNQDVLIVSLFDDVKTFCLKLDEFGSSFDDLNIFLKWDT